MWPYPIVAKWRKSPLMSILSHIHAEPPASLHSVHFLYSSRILSGDQSSILFLPRLHSIFSSSTARSWRFQLYLTNLKHSFTSETIENVWFPKYSEKQGSNQEVFYRRLTHGDAIDALGPVADRGSTVAYVCGPRGMTDEMVSVLRGAEGMAEERVRCEKWW